MSKRISIVDAKRKYRREHRIRRMQKEGKSIPKSLRSKKAKYQIDKQGSIIERMKNRINRNNGRMPEHLIEEDNNNLEE